jgi:hypothetical protein
MAPVPGDSSKHQFGTQMPQGGHPPHHSITSSARASTVVGISRPSNLLEQPQPFGAHAVLEIGDSSVLAVAIVKNDNFLQKGACKSH